ncbi:ESPR-type extended signal peptide-containing protein [Ignatzschineria cameli]|uniref:Trimeric autotransporter adhesin YadA-like C-terminal membrane anchor domain-containing protein n=1 Tax=Ignatzschineria cameli TaxID=2182793 RepID=A0ABX5KYD2_9GAMM|nr:ESPR-type extended signal peptide-containing protein [Ignatzschineria cameli]PWD88760.1 hypothetical protein DC079_08660 [Ignatzschineria cameli]PWD90604.1 hypothetical protein DC078_08660 [Ignatzschineria cameli]
MNKVYRVVWSYAKNAYVVVSELASIKVKSKGSTILKALTITLSFPIFLAGGVSNAELADNSIIAARDVEETPEYKELKEWLGKGNRWNPDKSSNAASLAEYAHNSMAIGWGARVNATQSIAMGIGATIFSQTTNALALGTASVVNSNADRGIAVGFNAQSRAHDALAIGSNSLVSNNAISAIAIGQSAKAAGEQSIALGKGASVDHKNSIAMRAGATTTRDNEVSIGSDSDTAYLSNITRGVLDTDAVNVSQLKEVQAKGDVGLEGIAEAFGGGAEYDKETGQLKAPNYKDALTADKNLNSVEAGFKYVGGQLTDQGKKITNIDGRVTKNEGDITSINKNINSIEDKVSAGTLGLVQLSKSEVTTEDGDSQEVTALVIDNVAAKEADVFNISNGKEGRTLTGVKAGQIAQDSLDAINGSQLHVANQNVAKVLGGNATFKDGQLTGVDFSGAFTGLAEGEKIESVYGGFENLDKRVDATSKVVDDINSGLGIGEDGESGSVGEVIGGIKDDVSKVVAGKAGLIQLNDGSTKLIIDNELAENALTFDISNGEEGRTLTGLADGTIATGSKDAVTGGQLFTVGTGVATALGGGAKLDEDGQLTGVNFQEALGTKDELINVYDAFENVGDTLSDHDFRLTENTTNIKSIINGKSGLVQLAEDGKSLVIDNKLAGGADTFDFSIRADEEDEAINRLLTGIAEGEISQNSVEAINGSQLHMANLNVANALGGKAELNEDGQLTRVNFQDALGAKDELTNVYAAFENVGGTLSKHDERITNNMNSINNIMGGEVGLIKLSGNRIVIDNSLAGVKVATIFDFSNGIDSRTLTGVANGKVSPDSLDAVNGSQLFATNQKFENITNINGKNLDGITDAMGGDAKVENGLLTGVDFGGALKAEKPITSVNEGFEYVTGRLDGQDKKLENHENRITNIEGNISNIADGKAGLIQVSEDGNSLIIDNGLAKDANTFNISNGDKDLTLTGVKDGQIVSESKDAINGSQLYASNKSIAEMFGGGATIDENGYITTPEYVIGDKTFNNVGASIEHLANSITTGEVGIFQLDREKNQIIIADNTDINSETTLNVGNRKIVGVANGKVEKGSQEVVNGGQLWETNQQVTSNTTQIKHINKTLDHYNNRISHLEKTVHENRKRASAGTASAMAMSSIPYMDYAKYSMGMGVASYDGEAAMSIGMEFKLGDNGRFRVQGSYDTQNKAGVGVGVAFSF